MPVNAYRWIRGFNEYDNWQASGVSGEGARSFYYPAKPQGCADCHMPLVPREGPRGDRTARCTRTASRAPTPRCPSSTATRSRCEVDAGVPEVGGGHDRRVRPRAGGARAARGARGRRRRAAAEHHVRGGRGVDELRRRAGVRHARRPRWWPRSTRWTRRCGGATRPGSTWWCGRAGSATSSRAARWTRSTCGSSSRSSTRTGRRSSTPASPRTPRTGGRGPVEPGAHFYRSLMLDEHGNADQQAERLGHAVGGLRAAHPARRRRHRALPPAHSRGLRRPDHGEGEAQLPQVRVVEHAVGLRGRPRPGAPGLLARRPDHDDGRWVFTGDTSGVSGKVKAIPDIPITVMDESGGPDPGPAEGIAPEPKTPPLPRRVGARAVERLRDRAAPAGRPEGRGGGLPEGHEDGAGLRGRVGERRPRAADGGQPRRRRGVAARRRSRWTPASPRPTSSSAPRSSSRAATTRRSRTCARRRRSTRGTAWCATRSAGCSS